MTSPKAKPPIQLSTVAGNGWHFWSRIWLMWAVLYQVLLRLNIKLRHISAAKKMNRRTWRWTCRRWVCRARCSRNQSSRSSVVERHWLLHAMSVQSADVHSPALNSVHDVETTPREHDRTCRPTPLSEYIETTVRFIRMIGLRCCK